MARSELTDVAAKLETPRHLAPTVHDLYVGRTTRNSGADHREPVECFTSAVKKLDPIAQFKAAAKLGEFLEGRFSQSFWQ